MLTPIDAQKISSGHFIEVLEKLSDISPLRTQEEIKRETIKHNFPISCMTCRHGFTHKGCGTPGPDFCLVSNALSAGLYTYDYTKHEFGDRNADEQALINTGLKNIVIGYRGEAEVNVKTSIQETYKILFNISGECGYLVSQSANTIIINNKSGIHTLLYDKEGLVSVYQQTENRKIVQWERPTSNANQTN